MNDKTDDPPKGDGAEGAHTGGDLPESFIGMMIHAAMLSGAIGALADMIGEIAPGRLEEAARRARARALATVEMTFAGGTVMGEPETPPSYIQGGNTALARIAAAFGSGRLE